MNDSIEPNLLPTQDDQEFYQQHGYYVSHPIYEAVPGTL
jgi:hypothetical protein